MLGLIAGDITRSVYEFASRRTKAFRLLFHKKSHFTDGMVCTVAVADAAVNESHPARALQDWVGATGTAAAGASAWRCGALTAIRSPMADGKRRHAGGAGMTAGPGALEDHITRDA